MSVLGVFLFVYKRAFQQIKAIIFRSLIGGSISFCMLDGPFMHNKYTIGLIKYKTEHLDCCLPHMFVFNSYNCFVMSVLCC